MASNLEFPILDELEAVKMMMLQVEERWPKQIYLSSFVSKEFVFMDNLGPYAFFQAFPSARRQDVNRLAFASLLFSASIFLYDHLMDRTSEASLATISALRIQVSQWEGYRILHELFPPSAVFWYRFRSHMLEYVQACIQEKHFSSGKKRLGGFTEELAFEIIRGKNGLDRTAIAGLAELAQDDGPLEPLVESLNWVNIAVQMWDDLEDWREDFCHRIPSLLLSRIIDEWPSSRDLEALDDGIESLARAVYYGGHASYVISLALDSLARARKPISDLPPLLLHRYIDSLERQLQCSAQDVERIIRSNLCRVGQQPHLPLTLPPAQNQWQQVAWDALRFVIRQWELGFGEARHILKVDDSQYQYGDIFQRALITDMLCDAHAVLQDQLGPAIDYEVNYLLKCRDTSGTGGWRYFPDWLAFPPDADVLAQMMQVLRRSGHRTEVARHCETPLNIMLTANAHADGSFGTWIMPAADRTPEQQGQADFVQLHALLGTDDGIIANLLYALTLYDQARFAEVIRRGISYLEWKQAADGHWESCRFHGPYYATYLCLQLMATANPESRSIPRGLCYLRSQQRADGAWGLEENESDALSTGLALLGLATAQCLNGDPEDRERAEHALTYLLQIQEDKKGWPNCMFIRQGFLVYGSRTITSAFVLKAALAWHRLQSSPGG